MSVDQINQLMVGGNQPFRVVPLTNKDGAVVALSCVDPEDYPQLVGHRWNLSKQGYAVRGFRDLDSTPHWVRLHRQITGAPPKQMVDHINGDRIDNRRCNLRLCSNAQNTRNSVKCRSTNPHIGVHWDKGRKRWIAQITKDYQNNVLGRFENLDDAIAARVAAEKRFFGEFAPNRELLPN